MGNINIVRVEHIDTSLINSINHLLRQLTSREILFTEQTLRQIIECPASHLFVMYDDEAIVGMITLALYQAPTGCKAWVEDVVIDTESRGKGLGHRLIQHAIEYARRYAPCTLYLTSNPLRTEANALYRSENFEQRTTNVYKMDL